MVCHSKQIKIEWTNSIKMIEPFHWLLEIG
jgi:hypothetical protein